MEIAGFQRFINALSEAALLVAADGRVLAANRAAARRLGRAPGELGERRLSELAAETPEPVAAYLQACSRSGEPLPGALTFVRPDGELLACRVEGAVVQPRSEAGPAILLLQFRPRGESPSQFAILTQRIDELTREIARRQRAEEELRAHREWLRVTLASIGDAVMATDDRGCITFSNTVAQALTGWRQEEAEGRPLEEVFRIINERTREPAEHPVARVLREGQIVGLANHTLLISRDGTEYPIDDSAAPIQADNGEILGVVLVFREVSERRRMEQELRERAEALAAAARRRDQFLSMLAHELRNPLGPIKNAVQILKRLGPPEPRLVRARETIDRQVSHQARMIDDLLEVSRITQGRITLQTRPVELRGLVEEAVEDARLTAEARGLTLSAALPDDPLWLDGDPTRLHQVLGNLLGNAIKFTDPGGSIAVRLAPDEQRLRAVLTVQDTGIGIEPELLPTLFEVFVQADRSLERTRGGLGLGLSLVKGIVELHGGTVRARSPGPGRGATFTVELPLGRAPTTGLAAPAAPTAAPMRVLLVEDNRDMAESLRDLLELVGCTVAIAHSGPEGIELARRFQPRVVFCDLGLPGMDGYQVARALRRDSLTARARLVAVTGYGEAEHQRRAREAGFDAHLTKPVQFGDVERFLQAAPGLELPETDSLD